MHVWPARRVGRLGVRGGEGSGEGGRQGGRVLDGGGSRAHTALSSPSGERRRGVCVFALDGAGKV